MRRREGGREGGAGVEEDEEVHSEGEVHLYNTFYSKVLLLFNRNSIHRVN